MFKELETQKTQNPDELPEIERSAGNEQSYKVTDLTVKVIAQHPVVAFEIAYDRFNGWTATESLHGSSFVKNHFCRLPASAISMLATPILRLPRYRRSQIAMDGHCPRRFRLETGPQAVFTYRKNCPGRTILQR